jgi:hypothetical protein
MAAKNRLRDALLFLAWALGLLWPAALHPNQPLMAPGAPFSDLLISHWPNAEFLRRSLFTYHQFPLWNPSIINGAPFAADPLAGIWYLPNWLTAVLPIPFAFNVLLVLHLAWAGWGMFRWARADGFSWLASVVGGLAYAAMPKLIAHLAAGHISLVFAVAWMPWLMHAVDNGWRSQTTPARFHRIALNAVIWAILFLADVRWGVYAGAVLFVWRLARWGWGRTTWLALALCSLAFLLLTGVLWLPLAEFVQYSSRTALTLQDMAEYSLPLNYLVGLFIPNLNGFHEYMTYSGLLALALAIAGAIKSDDKRGRWVMVGFVFFGLWWALGPEAGLFAVLSRLPGLSLLRVPPRSLFIVALAVCWLSVRGVAALETGWRLSGRGWNLASAGVLAAAWVLAIGGSAVTTQPLFNLFITAGALTLVVITFRNVNAFLLLPVFLALELFLVDSTFLESRPVLRSPVADWLSEHRDESDPWRVYSPSYSLPPLDAAQLGLEQADGVNPLQLATSAAYMEAASGVERTGYSVSIPSFNGDVATANEDAYPDAVLLGQLNVRYIVSEFDIVSAPLAFATQIGNTRVYTNVHDAHRVQGGVLTYWSPNRIVVNASGPGQVTLSEAWYPGWQATLDGSPIEIEQPDIFRAVTIPSGSHEIVFDFKPLSVFAGAALSLMGLLLVLFLWRRGE